VALVLITPFARATPVSVHETDAVDGVATTASELVINTTSAATRRSDASDRRVAALVVDLLYNKSTTRCGFVVQQIHNKSQ